MFLVLAASGQAATFRVLHEFGGVAGDGFYPHGSLIAIGSTLYGMTSAGGPDASSSFIGSGTIFQIGTDGSNYSILHAFGTNHDGIDPEGSLVASGSTLYGTTLNDVFAIGTDGTGFNVLHTFAGGSSDGQSALYSTPTLSGSTLYGVTSLGGTSNQGTLFQIGTDGTGFSLLHSFNATTDGENPIGAPLLSGSVLYGMTQSGSGSTTGAGTIYQIGVDGTNFTDLHNFGHTPNEPGHPYGSLIQNGSALFGMDPGINQFGNNSLFTVNTNGTGFTLLHTYTSFGGGAGSFLLSGTTLYGMSGNAVFEMNLDGSGYTTLHTFTGADGAGPADALIMVGNTLYGMTTTGGNDGGTIFSITVPEPSSLLLGTLGTLALAGYALRKKRAANRLRP